MSFNNPSIARSMALTQNFFAEQYVKNSPIVHPKKYEYLYSAFFTDFMLKDPIRPGERNPEPVAEYDGIVYPSVACNHELENFVITPQAASELIPYMMIEFLVTGTFYETSTSADAATGDLPISADRLRHSMIVENGQIIWNDE